MGGGGEVKFSRKKDNLTRERKKRRTRIPAAERWKKAKWKGGDSWDRRKRRGNGTTESRGIDQKGKRGTKKSAGVSDTIKKKGREEP